MTFKTTLERLTTKKTYSRQLRMLMMANQACLTISGGGQDGDLIMAFFPCIYFTGSTNPRYYTLENLNYQKMTTAQKIDAMLQRSKSRQYFYELIIKLVGVCLDRGFRIIIENPYSPLHYLCKTSLRHQMCSTGTDNIEEIFSRSLLDIGTLTAFPLSVIPIKIRKKKGLYTVVEGRKRLDCVARNEA